MKHKIRTLIEYTICWSLLKFLGRLPKRAARSLCSALTSLIPWILPKKIDIAHINLSIAFPELSKKQRDQIIRNMLQQLGWMVAEFAHFPYLNEHTIADTLTIEGYEHYTAAISKGKGFLFLSAHTSAWELIAFAFYKKSHHSFVRKIRNRLVDELISNYRSHSGLHFIDRDHSAKPLIKILRNNGGIGMIADQNSMYNGVFVDFFGKAASTTTGIARLALHTEATLLPGFIRWDQSTEKYIMRFEPAVELIRTGDKEADILANTAKFQKIIEQHIRNYPDQWLWIHKRWKTRPEGEDPIYPN